MPKCLSISTLYIRMTFSGCRAATRLLERCFILLDFKMYNVFLPMNVSTLKYNVFLPFTGFQTNARPVAHGDCFSWVGALNLIVNSPVGEINLKCEKLLNYRSSSRHKTKVATLCHSPTKYEYFRRVSKGR